MPELPEVECVARGLRRLAAGARIESVRCRLPQLVGGGPRRFAAFVRGRTLEGVQRHGKYLFLLLSGGRALALHLRMTGQLYVCPRGRSGDKHTHLELTLQGRGDKLVYRDVRKFGRLLPLPGTPAEFLRARRLGPDALGVSAAELGRALGRTSRGIKAALLDQSVLAGLGNIYTDEVLFREGLHPLRRADSLGAEAVASLARSIRRLLREATACNGTTVSDFVTAEGSAGAYQHRLRVYGREGEPCRRCGTPVARVRVAGRSSCFCPRCQPG